MVIHTNVDSDTTLPSAIFDAPVEQRNGCCLDIESCCKGVGFGAFFDDVEGAESIACFSYQDIAMLDQSGAVVPLIHRIGSCKSYWVCCIVSGPAGGRFPIVRFVVRVSRKVLNASTQLS